MLACTGSTYSKHFVELPLDLMQVAHSLLDLRQALVDALRLDLPDLLREPERAPILLRDLFQPLIPLEQLHLNRYLAIQSRQISTAELFGTTLVTTAVCTPE